MLYHTTLTTICTDLLFLSPSLMTQNQVVTVLENNLDEPLSFFNIASSKFQLMDLTNDRGRAGISHFSMAEIICFRQMGYTTVQLWCLTSEMFD